MKKFIVSAMLFLLTLFSGCNSAKDNSVDEVTANTITHENLSGELIRDVSRDINDTAALVKANNSFNSKLFLGLQKEDENLFFSPYSIFSALSMTYAGAMNETKKEFEKVLGFDANLSVHESFNKLLALQNYGTNLEVANSLWPQKGIRSKRTLSTPLLTLTQLRSPIRIIRKIPNMPEW